MTGRFESKYCFLKVVFVLLLLIVHIDLPSAAEESNNDDEEVYAIALNFHGAEPFPSQIGITPQVRFTRWFRFSAGWGFSRSDVGSGSSVGISAKFIPYSFDYPNKISFRPLIGIASAYYSSSDLVLFGVTPNRNVYSFDFGIEAKSQTILDFGLGCTVPINAGFLAPYARITVRLLKN